MNKPAQTHRVARRETILLAALVAPIALGLTGCSTVSKAISAVKVVHDIMHGSAAINSLTAKISAGDNAAYDVTYVTTGSSPATINYAARPPNDFAFDDSTSTSELMVFAGSAGQFECNRPKAGATWRCLETDVAGVNTTKLLYALYSGAYWIDFLKVYPVAAALHGVTISSSSLTVNGFRLQCAVVVSGKAPNQATSKVCVTSQGILGYVSVAAKAADFEIKSYSSSPAASLFQLPAGATVTTIPTSTTS